MGSLEGLRQWIELLLGPDGVVMFARISLAFLAGAAAGWYSTIGWGKHSGPRDVLQGIWLMVTLAVSLVAIAVIAVVCFLFVYFGAISVSVTIPFVFWPPLASLAGYVLTGALVATKEGWQWS